MMLTEYLSKRNVSFEQLPHEPAYTANRMAQMLHVPGREVAKTVLLRLYRGHVIAVLPANRKVDLQRICEILGVEQVSMASEDEMDALFPDCETGAVPPFGSMYNLPTLVDETLADDEQIVFEGNTHEESLRVKYRDYENLEHPRMGRFSYPI